MWLSEFTTHGCDFPENFSREEVQSHWMCDSCGAVYRIGNLQPWIRTWNHDYSQGSQVNARGDIYPLMQTSAYQQPMVEYHFVCGGIVGARHYNMSVFWKNAPLPDDYDEWVGQSRPYEMR